MNSTDRLTEELRRQARGLTDQHSLTLQDIQGRARGIRRRHAVTGVAAAAVLAVVVPLGDAWLVGGDAGDGARFTALFDDATGSETERFATRVAVSPDGSLAAYVRPEDGAAMILDSNGARQPVPVTVPGALATEEQFTIAAVHPCNAVDACLLIADLQLGDRPVAVRVDRDGTQHDSGHLKVGDRSIDGTVEGRVTSGQSGSVCSSVRPPQGQGWDTCRWELARFSPDGRFVMRSSLEDGRGPRTLVLLDARDGTLVRELAARGGTDVFVRQAVWESPDSVLATVWDSD